MKLRLRFPTPLYRRLTQRFKRRRLVGLIQIVRIIKNAWPLGLSAVLCGVWLWPDLLLHAAPAAHTERHEIRVLSWLRGARIKPADAAARDRIRRAANPQHLPQSSGVSETPSVSDQEQALGLTARLAAANQHHTYYDLHFAALVRLGTVRYRRTGDSQIANSTTNSAPSGLQFIPGDQLELGLRFCDGCTLSLGRRVPDPLMGGSQPERARLVDRLGGGHGSLTGVHLGFAHPRYGGIAVTPLYRPELSGSFLMDAAHDFQSNQESDSLSGDHAANWQRDFLKLAGKARSYAHRAACALRLGPVLLGFDYALHRQDDTANPTFSDMEAKADPAAIAQANRFRRSVDHIAYAGLGLAAAGEYGQAYLHLQRSSGAYRTLLAGSADGLREARIEGVRLSTGFTIRPGPLRLRVRFTLPEPERAKRPGETRPSRSGYVGFGNAELNAPVLRDTLDFLPAPRLCSDRDRCSGLDRQNLRVDFAEDFGSDSSERLRDAAAFRDLAAVFEIQLGYATARSRSGNRLSAEFGLSIFAPLAPRPAGGRNPFQRLKKDPLGFEYREFSLLLEREFGTVGALTFGYSRLYRRHRATGSLLAGESLRLGLRYHF